LAVDGHPSAAIAVDASIDERAVITHELVSEPAVLRVAGLHEHHLGKLARLHANDFRESVAVEEIAPTIGLPSVATRKRAAEEHDFVHPLLAK
jgi:hypothetical protein